MKIDCHVHSKYSRRPAQWILQKIGCPESFAEPVEIYRIARERGMTAVTITDHNSIDGALEIAHLPGVILGEEITAYFPEDRCKLHVLALGITEAHHSEIQRLRQNVFELATYLNQENILSIVAHPFYPVNDRLTLAHFEQTLLLFRNFEINGTRSVMENRCLSSVLSSLTPDRLDRIAESHGHGPTFQRPWEKTLFGGSDDHSSLYIARTFTEIDGHALPSEGTGDRSVKQVTIHGQPTSPLEFAHSLYGNAWQFYRSKFRLQRYADRDTLVQYLDRSLTSEKDVPPSFFNRLFSVLRRGTSTMEQNPASDSLVDLLRFEAGRVIRGNRELPLQKDEALAPHQQWFDFVNQAVNRVLLHFTDHLMDHLSGAKVFDVFHTIGSSAGLLSLLAPYFVAYTNFNKGKALSNEAARHFAALAPWGTESRPARVAHFTDTYYEVNGVAKTLQQHVQCAVENGKNMVLITCDTQNRAAQPGVEHFKPVGVFALPEYPEQQVFVPPLLEMMNYCWTENISHIHTATPGPIGLAALAIARMLKLPISGTYHTELPQYAQILTGDDGIEDLIWRYTLWYYDQLDWVYAPSNSTKAELTAKGIPESKIRLYPRGIDIAFYHPSRKNGYFANLPIRDSLKLLYVGRVSMEKNLPLLLTVFKGLVGSGENVSLVIVGDGPYLPRMKREAVGLPCLFTGYLEGETLATVYASSDLFVFPSTTDTFGNVVLEAQASGLPVIVSDQGGPKENIVPDVTGLVTAADDPESLASAIRTLLADPRLMAKMGISARRHMEDRSFKAAFMETWRMYTGIRSSAASRTMGRTQARP